MDLLRQRATEVQTLMRSVPGLVSYSLVRTDDGGFTMTVCDDDTGVEASVEKAKGRIAKNGTHLGAAAPRKCPKAQWYSTLQSDAAKRPPNQCPQSTSCAGA